MCQITNDLESYQFFEVPLDGEIGEAAVRIASDFGITIYDSSYIAVGKVRKLDVFTADQKLLDKVPETRFCSPSKRLQRQYGWDSKEKS